MRFSALVMIVFAALCIVAPASAAPVFDTPDALVAYAYKPYLDGDFPEDPFELYAPALREKVDRAIAEAGDEVVSGLDFDPFVDAQDYDAVTAELVSVEGEGGRALAKVAVSNFGTDFVLEFDLVRTDRGWLIEDIARPEGEYVWRLNDLLTNDPLLN